MAIGHAAEFDPDNQAYAAELRNIQRMADEARRLAEQGVTGP